MEVACNKNNIHFKIRLYKGFLKNGLMLTNLIYLGIFLRFFSHVIRQMDITMLYIYNVQYHQQRSTPYYCTHGNICPFALVDGGIILDWANNRVSILFLLKHRVVWVNLRRSKTVWNWRRAKIKRDENNTLYR